MFRTSVNGLRNNFILTDNKLIRETPNFPITQGWIHQDKTRESRAPWNL